MTLGKYVNNDTFIHRLDPRNKFIMLFVLMIVIFLINPSRTYFQVVGWTMYIVLMVAFIALYKVAKLKFSMIFKSLKPMWFMMIFLFIINLFVYKGGPQIIPEWWIFDIHLEAIVQTLKIVLRLLLLITLSTLFTATTKPLDITVAIDDLFAWLKVFKINVHILSMTISIALRFIPTILDETYRIMKAQASRGVDFQNGKLKEKMVAITSLIVPLFISSISRSDDLANAMEARNYNPLAKRTRYRNLKWHLSDTVSMIISFIMVLGYVALLVLFNNNIFDLNSIIMSFFTSVYELIKGWF